MTLFLAQMPNPTGEQLLAVLLGGTAILIVAEKIHAIIYRQRRQPSLEAEFATKDEVHVIAAEAKADNNALRSDFNILRNQIKTDFDIIQRSGEARAGKIHDRINEVLEKVSQIAGRCMAQHNFKSQ